MSHKKGWLGHPFLLVFKLFKILLLQDLIFFNVMDAYRHLFAVYRQHKNGYSHQNKMPGYKNMNLKYFVGIFRVYILAANLL